MGIVSFQHFDVDFHLGVLSWFAVGPTKAPANYVNEILVREYQETGRLNMQETLKQYVRICGKMGVQSILLPRFTPDVRFFLSLQFT